MAPDAKVLQACATFLSRWRGASGEMWELTRSHRSLRLVLSRGGADGNLVLACLDPSWIAGPVRWDNADIAVTREPGPDGEFRVVDTGVGLDVRCGWLEVAENVKRFTYR
jgi:hypothetical protein